MRNLGSGEGFWQSEVQRHVEGTEVIKIRERLEAYVKATYGVESEQLPFRQEDYAVLRHADTGRWFAVFIVKPKKAFDMDGEGNTEIVSLKIRDPLLADLLVQQTGYLRGYPSSKWNWVSIILDGTVPLEEVCRWLDESYAATKAKAKNQIVPLVKRNTILKEGK